VYNLHDDDLDGGTPSTGDDDDSSAAGWLSDANISRLLVDRVLRGKYCWAKGFGWMAFDGKKWAPTTDQDVIERSRLFATDLVAEQVAKRADPEKIRAYTRRLSNGAVTAAANLAKGQLLAKATDFDQHPDLLNVANGVVNLRIGTLGPHDPALLLTKCAPTEYHPGATHVDWDTALAALPDDVAEWVQLRLGQAVTGYPTPDDVLPVFHGGGSNGKTTLTIGVIKALGDHAATVPDRVLLANPGDHPTELMTLRGARMALLEETPEARHLNVKRLKDTVGAPRMSARHIRQDVVEWDCTHSLFLSTNYRPKVDETDHGTWRRLALVTFPFTYRRDGDALEGENDRHGDPTLRQRIQAGRDCQHQAVMRWLIDGARRWYAAGQVMGARPKTVEDDTLAWRLASDLVLHFFSDKLVADAGYYIPSSELYEAFTKWLTIDNGYQKWTSQTFTERFGQHDEVCSARPRIVHTRIRQTTTNLLASRPHLPYVSPFDPSSELPGRFWAWTGVRLRTDADDRRDDDDQGK
jgi:putative DNA primase/helicase